VTGFLMALVAYGLEPCSTKSLMSVSEFSVCHFARGY